MNRVKIGPLLLLASTALEAALPNTEVVTLRFRAGETRVSRVAVTLVTPGIGFLLGVPATPLIHRKS